MRWPPRRWFEAGSAGILNLKNPVIEAYDCASFLLEMTFYPVRVLLSALVLACVLSGCTTTGTSVADSRNQVIISARDQRLTVVKSDRSRETFAISTSKFGLGDAPRSFATPLGKMEIAGKIGAGAPAGSVFRGRVRTGEIVPENAPGRDPIVTRILRLRGLEGQNSRAASRGIYIHGTPEESRIGEPVSYGCIRMRSRDVIRLFDLVGVGSPVMILDSPLYEAVAAAAPPLPAKDAAPATGATPAEDTARPGAPPAASVAVASTKPEVRVLSNVKRDGNGTWAGDPEKMLADQTVPKKAVARPKAKPVQLAQRSKSTRNKPGRSDEDGSL